MLNLKASQFLRLIIQRLIIRAFSHIPSNTTSYKLKEAQSLYLRIRGTVCLSYLVNIICACKIVCSVITVQHILQDCLNSNRNTPEVFKLWKYIRSTIFDAIIFPHRAHLEFRGMMGLSLKLMSFWLVSLWRLWLSSSSQTLKPTLSSYQTAQVPHATGLLW